MRFSGKVCPDLLATHNAVMYARNDGGSGGGGGGSIGRELFDPTGGGGGGGGGAAQMRVSLGYALPETGGKKSDRTRILYT